MDSIFHLVYILCFYDPNLLKYNQFHRGGEYAKKKHGTERVNQTKNFSKLETKLDLKSSDFQFTLNHHKLTFNL